MRPRHDQPAACASARSRLAAVAWVFAGPLFAGRVLYYRDVSVTYYPDFVFVARALARGVWPLWHPGADGGAPFLMAYPVHLLLLPRRARARRSPSRRRCTSSSPWRGTAALARRLGASPAGARVRRGLLRALRPHARLGPVSRVPRGGVGAARRSSASSPSSRRRAAAAWPPSPSCWRSRRRRSAPRRSWRRPSSRSSSRRAGPVVAPRSRSGGRAPGGLPRRARPPRQRRRLLRGTARGAGFDARRWPRTTPRPRPCCSRRCCRASSANPHDSRDVGYWGQPFFPSGSPFFLSLYLGPVVLLLAARAGVGERRLLWALAGLGVLLGARGSRAARAPMLGPPGHAARPGQALRPDDASRSRCWPGGARPRPGEARPPPLLAPAPRASLLLAVALAARLAPGAVSTALSLRDPRRRRRAGPQVDRRALAAGARGRRVSSPSRPGSPSPPAAAPRPRSPGSSPSSTSCGSTASSTRRRMPPSTTLRPAVRRGGGAARRRGALPLVLLRRRPLAAAALESRGRRAATRTSGSSTSTGSRCCRAPTVLDGLDGAFDVDRMGLAPAGLDARRRRGSAGALPPPLPPAAARRGPLGAWGSTRFPRTSSASGRPFLSRRWRSR